MAKWSPSGPKGGSEFIFYRPETHRAFLAKPACNSMRCTHGLEYFAAPEGKSNRPGSGWFPSSGPDILPPLLFRGPWVRKSKADALVCRYNYNNWWRPWILQNLTTYDVWSLIISSSLLYLRMSMSCSNYVVVWVHMTFCFYVAALDFFHTCKPCHNARLELFSVHLYVPAGCFRGN